MKLITRYNAVNYGWFPYNTGRRCLGDKCLAWIWAESEEASENLSICKGTAGSACSEDCSRCAYRLGRCALISTDQQQVEQQGDMPVYRGSFIMSAE